MAAERTISSSQLIGMSGARGGITAFARPLVSEPCQALVSLARNAILTLAAGCPSRRSFRQFTRFSSIVRTMVGLYKPGSEFIRVTAYLCFANFLRMESNKFCRSISRYLSSLVKYTNRLFPTQASAMPMLMSLIPPVQSQTKSLS